MNIACISHYSSLDKNYTNAWIADFYSSAPLIENIENVYFFYIRYHKKGNFQITKTKVDNKITDIKIEIPIMFKLLRRFNFSDQYFIVNTNRAIRSFLEQVNIRFDIVHVNTLYYSFIADGFKEVISESNLFLHIHENKNLLNKILFNNKYNSTNFLGKYDYIIRQTPIEIDVVKKYNSNILYLPNAFNNRRFLYSKKENSEKSITIVSIGYLKKTKNYKLSLDVIKDLINNDYKVKYIIIGSGEESRSLKKYTKRIGLNNVVNFCGYQNPEKVQEYLKESDLLLNTSYFESFGNVFLEALTTGTPIVTCAKGGPEYLFKWSNKSQVYLGEYSSASVKELSFAITKVLKSINSTEDIKETSSVICQRFSSERFLTDLTEMAKNGLNSKMPEWWKE